jgi:hypothetical protein
MLSPAYKIGHNPCWPLWAGESMAPRSVPDCSAWQCKEQGAETESSCLCTELRHQETGSENLDYAIKMLLTDARGTMLKLNDD